MAAASPNATAREPLQNNLQPERFAPSRLPSRQAGDRLGEEREGSREQPRPFRQNAFSASEQNVTPATSGKRNDQANLRPQAPAQTTALKQKLNLDLGSSEAEKKKHGPKPSLLSPRRLRSPRNLRRSRQSGRAQLGREAEAARGARPARQLGASTAEPNAVLASGELRPGPELRSAASAALCAALRVRPGGRPRAPVPHCDYERSAAFRGP